MKSGMTSADHDHDTLDQSKISPELVLVDPELARRLHERDRVRARRSARLPVLRLVPDASSGSSDHEARAGPGDPALL
jgi:tRNA A37 N6-isopentenylltransferase MiaA